MRKILASIVALIALGACAAEEDPSISTPDSGGVETNSRNEEHPPPEDINDDLACTANSIGPVASGTLTNNSSELSGYMISVSFTDDAGTRVADGTAFVNNVQAGQTANWEAPSLTPDVDYATCEIVKVDRFAQ